MEVKEQAAAVPALAALCLHPQEVVQEYTVPPQAHSVEAAIESLPNSELWETILDPNLLPLPHLHNLQPSLHCHSTLQPTAGDSQTGLSIWLLDPGKACRPLRNLAAP